MTYIQLYTSISLALIINMIILSCTTMNNYNLQDPNYLYKTAQIKLQQHNYIEAIQNLTKLKKLHLFDPCPQQIDLDLIYAYYKSNDLKSANDYINHFLKLYPDHKNLDYVLYMHGIINMRLDKQNTKIIQCFNIDRYNRNPIHANTAFHSLSKIIRDYPNSQYFFDSYKRLIFLKNRIANYELSIIKFYDQRHAYISVITRTEKMLRYFPDTSATQEALHYMKRAYQHIHLPKQANKIDTIITENQTTY